MKLATKSSGRVGWRGATSAFWYATGVSATLTVITDVGDLHGPSWFALRTAVALVWLAAVLVLLVKAGAALRSYRPQQRTPRWRRARTGAAEECGISVQRTHRTYSDII